MTIDEKLDFLIVLLLEQAGMNNQRFNEYLEKNYNVESINRLYKKVLDKFLEPYALNKIEKSK